MRSLRSNSVTWCPAWLSCAAAASPDGPDPITATVRPVRKGGGSGAIQPSSHALSEIACSICLIVTASSLMSSTHAASHGAGQMRPVNSGKLFVASAMRLASRQRPRNTASFQSGIRLPSGQPEWQKGMPQSMQRAPWSFSSGSASGSWYSSKSWTRCAIGRFGPLTRWIFMKPPISPIARQHLLGGLGLGLLLGAVARAARAGGAADFTRSDGGVLVLTGLPGPRSLLVAVGRRVRGALSGAHRARAVAVAALADHRGLAGLGGEPLGLLAHGALVVHGHDLHPGAAGGELVPALEHARRDRRIGALGVLLHERTHLLEVLLVAALELHKLRVASRREGALAIEHVRDAAAHARGEVAPGRPEHDHAAACHVLAAVV